ncbi:MAG: NAD-dependent dehydratase, partial [Acholeplasmataceae bacterium]|nr:NAD-dependent dehydratase [Acholeplasmataceae bacterium]
LAEKLGWKPAAPLCEGLRSTYAWIREQVRAREN